MTADLEVRNCDLSSSSHKLQLVKVGMEAFRLIYHMEVTAPRWAEGAPIPGGEGGACPQLSWLETEPSFLHVSQRHSRYRLG